MVQGRQQHVQGHDDPQGVAHFPRIAPRQPAEQGQAAGKHRQHSGRVLQHLHRIPPPRIACRPGAARGFLGRRVIELRLGLLQGTRGAVPGSGAGVARGADCLAGQQATAHHVSSLAAARQTGPCSYAAGICLHRPVHHGSQPAVWATILHFVQELLKRLMEAVPCAQERDCSGLVRRQHGCPVIRMEHTLQRLQDAGHVPTLLWARL
mmetsp:Transcript_25702/g.66168  ORF Transcript_25702/g.66168 Transcript_25702/m.66168 type:complete len:208 (+) Transcript_25702:1255-1878(+)